MEQQLTGPNVTRPSRRSEYSSARRRTRGRASRPRLRAPANMLRNRHAGEVATLLTALGLEDQVVVFRVLPRKDAAAVFEYLSHEGKTAPEAMAQEDVMTPQQRGSDDRTLFLEELPAEATRQLLALLTPAERSVAMTLRSAPEIRWPVGTPHYVATRERTVREVLDHVQAHGNMASAERHLRGRRTGFADRRCSHSRVPAGSTGQSRCGPHGSTLCRAEGHG